MRWALTSCGEVAGLVPPTMATKAVVSSASTVSTTAVRSRILVSKQGLLHGSPSNNGEGTGEATAWGSGEPSMVGCESRPNRVSDRCGEQGPSAHPGRSVVPAKLGGERFVASKTSPSLGWMTMTASWSALVPLRQRGHH
jgi:hypothetical protein